MASIQIFGVRDHQKTLLLKQNVCEALHGLSLTYPVEEVYEINSLLDARISGIPALKVGDKIITQENIPSVEDLAILFKVLFKSSLAQLSPSLEGSK